MTEISSFRLVLPSCPSVFDGQDGRTRRKDKTEGQDGKTEGRDFRHILSLRYERKERRKSLTEDM